MCESTEVFGPCGSLHQATTKPRGAKEAGYELARLMERQLGYQEGRIDSVALRLFIRAYWSRVSKLAHEIHDDNG